MLKLLISLGSSVIVFFLLNCYVGWHFLMMIDGWGVAPSLLWYWLIYGLLAFSFFLVSLPPSWLLRRHAAYSALVYVSSLYLGIFAIALPLLALADLLGWGAGLAPLPAGLTAFGSAVYANGGLAFGIALLCTLYGFYRARRIALTEYDVVINKAAPALPQARIVMISDLHLGNAAQAPQLDTMVRRVKELRPDLFLLGGDVFDHGTTPALTAHAAAALGSIKATYGSYYVVGNHEHYLGPADPLANTGMRRLFDETVEIAGSLYLVGAKDDSFRDRLRTEQLVAPLDRSKPVILLAHQPSGIAENEMAGVDLQLSGHTHRGQIFPGTLLVRLFHRRHYGYYRCRRLQLIVSSGAGTWGFPLRIGSQNEMVLIRLEARPPR
ncbi:MAG: metallophosphoesterase [Syntrophomonadaceae bacterium]|nr:metallophosphoesterase [Syntrophomonadaceae bacterium]